MADSNTQGVEIKAKARTTATDDAGFVGPTPNNTPVQPAPIAARIVSERPTVDRIEEGDSDDEGTAAATIGGAPPIGGAPAGDLFAGNQRLVNMLQGKLGTLLGRSSGYVEGLSAATRRRINGLKYLQSKHTELESQFHKDILELEKRYLELYRPLYEKRAKVIQGELEPTAEEVEAGKSDAEGEDEDSKEPEEEQAEETSDAEPGIPEFWLTAFKNHAGLCELITEADEEPLKMLTDVRIQYTDDKPGFMLTFEFGENDYFTDKTLTKTYYYQQSAGFGDLVYESSHGCDIHWKEGKDLTVTIETKKQRHKTSNKTRVVKRAVPNETFFIFFSTIVTPENEEELEEEEQDELDARLEADYELGEEFKEKIIPHAVDWFTGKALQYESMDMEDDYDENDLYYGDTTDEEEDDDDYREMD